MSLEDFFDIGRFLHTEILSENANGDATALKEAPWNAKGILSFDEPVAPEAIAALERLFDISRLPDPNMVAFPDEDALDGSPADAFLKELQMIQIPALKTDIDVAIRALDPIKDASAIKELQELKANLETMERELWQYQEGGRTVWGAYAENQPLTPFGEPITPQSAYKAIIDELNESRERMLGSRNILA